MFLIDNNLSPRIAAQIADFFPGSTHVVALGLEQADDERVFEYARDNRLAILTKDADFYHLLNKYGHPPKVCWIRVGNVTTNQIIALLRDNNALIQDFLLSSPAGILELY